MNLIDGLHNLCLALVVLVTVQHQISSLPVHFRVQAGGVNQFHGRESQGGQTIRIRFSFSQLAMFLIGKSRLSYQVQQSNGLSSV